MKLGIIPAAGKAERFGGVAKELLVTRDGETLLKNAVEQLFFCEKRIIVSTDDKIQFHASICKDCYHVPQVGSGLHGAISICLTTSADQYFVVMPDTVFEPSVFEMFGDKLNNKKVDLYLGYFYTTMPHRFGVDIGGRWVDKPDIKPGLAYFKAWGFIGFSRRLRGVFSALDIPEFINYCFNNSCNIAQAEMTSYHDMATVEDYKEYLCG